MKPSENKLLAMLSNHDVTFFIPPYQRNYEWTSDQCQVFLDDIQRTAEINASGVRANHFFGTITYYQTGAIFGEPDKLILIDGQQRITTTMLFLIAWRNIITEDRSKEYVDSNYLKNNNAGADSEYKVKLKQVETDWASYKKLVLSEELTDAEKNSFVYRNYSFFKNKLLEYQRKGGDINCLISDGLAQFCVVSLQLQPLENPWESPQEIFESMNSLGKPLSLADLVRNYLLLGKAPDVQEELYHRYWLPIERVIPGHVSDFIRDYMQAHEKNPLQNRQRITQKIYIVHLKISLPTMILVY